MYCRRVSRYNIPVGAVRARCHSAVARSRNAASGATCSRRAFTAFAVALAALIAHTAHAVGGTAFSLTNTNNPAGPIDTTNLGDLGVTQVELGCCGLARFVLAEDGRVFDRNARWLAAHPGTLVLIEGHADDRGTNEYNLALGESRAKATRDQLVARGVARSRITTLSYGEERPACRDAAERCWARNRRAHFLVKSAVASDVTPR